MEKRPKILIVDDEDIVIKGTTKILQRENYDLDSAYSGTEALEKMKVTDYDLVITDLMMPGLNGIEVLKKIKSDYPDVIVVMFTGYATVESAREALKLGAFDYIPKPFTPDELREVVKNAIEAKEKKSEAKMLDLMAIVSHELRSPTSAIHTTAETLYKGYFGKLDPEQQKIVESILRNCRYLEDIIRNYLDLSKMEMDNLESFQKSIDFINEVVIPVINIPEHQNNLKKMSIKTDFATTPIINGDPNLLKIVVTNLLNNAIKYGREETEIKLSMKKVEGGYIFSVYNEGVGISKDDIERNLFKKFVRLKQKGTEGIKGSGLGLYMCKKIVEKHEGRIWAESEEGKWVQFNVFLPERKSE
ncbi:MAG: response regulator [Spirochaetes bacterium]|nr:response regulator [Spirochaetota bacterium]